MWINCYSDSIKDIKVSYYISDVSFCIHSVSDNLNIDNNAELMAYFCYEDDFKKFSVGKYYDDGKCMILDKQYSILYIKSMGVSPENFSHFKIIAPEGEIINLFPDNNVDNIYSDRAIISAKETLASLKSNGAFCDVEDIINKLNVNLKKYPCSELPLLGSFTWYIINDCTETFGLSSVKHLINSPNFYCYSDLWYFGVSDRKRIYAVATRGRNNSCNPLSNADDCTVIYRGENADVCYYVVGIILLDDGQYFCRLE